MPRYNRDDYSAGDWRATKSDVLRNSKQIGRRRRRNVGSVIGIIALLILTGMTLHGLLQLTGVIN